MNLVLLIGLPASGKSSFYRRHLSATHDIISKDLMKGKRNRDHKQRVLLEEKALAGRPVVLDNTHPSKESRRPWIAWAHERGWTVTGYYLSCSVEECQRRNQSRNQDELVPDVGFYSILGSLERPQHEEGFDDLFFVTSEDANFQIERWSDDEKERL